MPHYYVKPENIFKKHFVVKGDEAYHLIRVLRVRVGQELNLFDGTSKLYTGKVEEVKKDEVIGSILEAKAGFLPKIPVTLYQAIPKGERFDWLVEKGVELGLKKIVPLYTERSVTKDISDSKIARWQRVALAASEQSGRPDIMEVASPMDFFEAIKSVPEKALAIIPWESEVTETVSSAAKKVGNLSEAHIFIGPEGGFTGREINSSVAKGVIAVTLGERILRAETAGLLAAILVLNLAGEYGA